MEKETGGFADCGDELAVSWPSSCLLRQSLAGSTFVEKRQWCRVKKLEDLSEDGNSIFEVNAELMARAATKTEAASDQLDALHRALLSTTLDGAAPYGGVTSSATRVRRENEDEEWSGLAGLFGAFEGSLTGESFCVGETHSS